MNAINIKPSLSILLGAGRYVIEYAKFENGNLIKVFDILTDREAFSGNLTYPTTDWCTNSVEILDEQKLQSVTLIAIWKVLI